MKQIIRSDLLITGAGVAGLTAALVSLQLGASVTIVEKQKGFATSGNRVFILSDYTRRILEALGIWDDLQGKDYPITTIRIYDGLGTAIKDHGFGWMQSLSFSHDRSQSEKVGYIVREHVLMEALIARISSYSSITILFDCAVENYELTQKGCLARLDSGKSLSVGLVLGCDGKNSHTAAKMNIKRTQKARNQHAFVFTVSHAMQNRRAAYQTFFKGGQLAVLPLSVSKSSIMWSVPTAEMLRLKALSKQDFMAACAAHLKRHLGDCALAGEIASFPLNTSMASAFVAERLALVGDAAHTFHPITGQGVNYTFRDIAELIPVIRQGLTNQWETTDLAAALDIYNARRTRDARLMSATTDMLLFVFSLRGFTMTCFRRLGFVVMHSLPLLRYLLVRLASGSHMKSHSLEPDAPLLALKDK